MKFQLIIKNEMVKNKDFTRFKLSDVVLSWVEYKKVPGKRFHFQSIVEVNVLNACLQINVSFLISLPKHMLWVLNETVLLSTQIICLEFWVRK